MYAMRNEIILIFGSFIWFGFEFHCGINWSIWIVPSINEMMRIKTQQQRPKDHKQTFVWKQTFVCHKGMRDGAVSAPFIHATFIWCYWILSPLFWQDDDEVPFVLWTQFDEIIGGCSLVRVNQPWTKWCHEFPKSLVSALLFYYTLNHK